MFPILSIGGYTMNYDQLALEYAEKYGIINYKVINNEMVYYEYFPSETYKAIVNLDTMKESRSSVKERKQ